MGWTAGHLQGPQISQPHRYFDETALEAWAVDEIVTFRMHLLSSRASVEDKLS